MATKKKTKTQEPPRPEVEPIPAREAILVELENVAFNGRQVQFDVLKSLLADKDVKLSTVMYSRYCVDTPVAAALPALLKSTAKPRTATDKLAAEVIQGVQLSLAGGTSKPNATVTAMIREAADSGVRIGALTSLDPEIGPTLAAALGLNAEQVKGVTFESAADAPDIDDWMALAAALNLDPSLCVAVTTSQKSCLGALAAGMRCIAVPDAFTDFQSFSGADVVCDSFDELQVKEMLSLLAPRL